jgi:PAS domain S-box-containing protein
VAAQIEQETEYRAIFEASSDGLVINNAETGVVVEANPAFCRMHGHEQMVGLHPTTFIHPDSHHLFEDYFRTVREGGEYRVRAQDARYDGSVFDVEVLGRGFTYQAASRCSAWCATSPRVFRPTRCWSSASPSARVNSIADARWPRVCATCWQW